MKNIIIYGTGTVANSLFRRLNSKNVNLICFAVDNYKENNSDNTNFQKNSPLIIDSKSINNYDYDYVVIGFSKVEIGINNLLRLKVPKEKIIGYMPIPDDVNFLNRIESICNKESSSYLNDSEIGNLFNITPLKLHPCTMSTHNVCEEIIEWDFVRHQTLYLLSEEINHRNLSGAVAELGVYKGDFSKKINFVFPNKDLYLFDTFEGFEQKDIKSDQTVLSANSELEKFRNTSVEYVLNNIPNPNKCIVKKGYFPDTFDLDDSIKFCFVSIDVDLYSPIKAGLEVFYPRLVPGGYIMVHDYNSLGYIGTKKAVLEYCSCHHLSFTPIPDNAGSVVISKPM